MMLQVGSTGTVQNANTCKDLLARKKGERLLLYRIASINPAGSFRVET